MYRHYSCAGGQLFITELVSLLIDDTTNHLESQIPVEAAASMSAVNLIRHILNPDPKQRYTIEDIKADPWLQVGVGPVHSKILHAMLSFQAYIPSNRIQAHLSEPFMFCCYHLIRSTSRQAHLISTAAFRRMLPIREPSNHQS